jgi:hypothetical protein
MRARSHELMLDGFFYVSDEPGVENGSAPFRNARRLAAMRMVMILCACAVLGASLGCSCVSTVERVNRTPMESREEYVKSHPDCTFGESILNGEIVRGMCAPEVIASWGLPNVYAVEKSSPTEQWIYYLKDRDSLTMLIYTLTFADDTLQVWDIDQKRFVGQGIVSTDDFKKETSAAAIDDQKRR